MPAQDESMPSRTLDLLGPEDPDWNALVMQCREWHPFYLSAFLKAEAAFRAAEATLLVFRARSGIAVYPVRYGRSGPTDRHRTSTPRSAMRARTRSARAARIARVYGRLGTASPGSPSMLSPFLAAQYASMPSGPLRSAHRRRTWRSSR